MRTLALLVVVSGLAACNFVTSSAPLFGPSDEIGPPSLRPGVWASPDKGCDFDPNRPLATWPSCANGFLTTSEDFRSSLAKLVFVGGSSPLIQDCETKGDPPATNCSYYGWAAVSADASRRVTAMRFWTVQCGPPPPSSKTQKRYGTLHPLPGLVMDKDGDDCQPASADAVRQAAAASRAWSTPSTLTWVRDGDV